MTFLGWWNRWKKLAWRWLISTIDYHVLIVNDWFIHHIVLWTSSFRHIRVTKRLNLMTSHITQELDVLICSHQFTIQYLHMSFQLLNLFRLGIIILHRSIFNRPRLCSILQRTIVLRKVFVTRMQTCNHSCKCISSNTLS